MRVWLWIAMGGAIGAVARYATTIFIHQFVSRDFPYGTLLVNVLGSFLMGFLAMYFIDKMGDSLNLKGFWLIGILGAYTTFSTFSIDTLALIENRSYIYAISNISLSLFLCLFSTWFGIILGRTLQYT